MAKTGHTRHEDREFMLNPELWPMWPALSVKRRKPGGGWPDLGILLDSHASEPTVYLTTLHDLVVNENALEVCTKETFKDVDEMLQAGWIVD